LLLLQVEQMGANIAANGSREQMSYTIDCLRSHMPAALELLADCVINPAFLPHEIEEQKARMQLLLSLPDVQLTLLSEVRCC
jgi:processing peptidase subunit alpha